MRTVSTEPNFNEISREDNSITYRNTLTMFNEIYVMGCIYVMESLNLLYDKHQWVVCRWKQGRPLTEPHTVYTLHFIEPLVNFKRQMQCRENSASQESAFHNSGC